MITRCGSIDSCVCSDEEKLRGLDRRRSKSRAVLEKEALVERVLVFAGGFALERQRGGLFDGDRGRRVACCSDSRVSVVLFVSHWRRVRGECPLSTLHGAL
jgi:hypothetical protein